jgi:hypothetical protein
MTMIILLQSTCISYCEIRQYRLLQIFCIKLA